MRVRTAPHPFKSQFVDIFVPEGLTIKQIVEKAQPDPLLRVGAAVFIDDHLILPEFWHVVRPKRGRLVAVNITPMGGGGKKNPLRTILSIAVMAASGWAAGAFATSLALGVTGTGVATAFQVGVAKLAIGAGVSLVGGLLVDAIAPPPTPKLGTLSGTNRQESPSYFIEGAQNRARKFERVPRVLGQYRMVPDLAAEPYTEIVGDDQYLRMVFCWGYGELDLSDLKIGETSIDEFEDIEIEHRYGAPGDAPLTLYSNDIHEEAYSIELTNAGSWQTRTTEANVDEISVDIAFPSGLLRFDSMGNRQSTSVEVAIEYAPTGTGSWVSAGSISLTEKRSSEIRKNKKWSVATGQYDVRLRRVTADTTSDLIYDDVYWVKMRSITSTYPFDFPVPLALTAIRIRATGQLNGILNELSGLAKSILPVWDGVDWETKQITSNPAALIREVWQGSANSKPLLDSEINLENLQDFYDDCETNGYTFNAVIDYETSIGELTNDISSAGRASPNRPDGRMTIVMDRPGKVPCQHFSARNTWDYKGLISYPEIPHAFRVRFPNAEKDYRQDERIVYADGYNSGNATDFEVLELNGITDADLAWKHGRFHLAQGIYRREKFTFWCDFENLSCTKGDLVYFAHDVPRFGLGSGRIKERIFDAGDVIGFVVDETLEMESGQDYCIRVRRKDQSSQFLPLTTVVGTGNTITLETPLDPMLAPEVGDLFMFGELNEESIVVLITGIRRGSNETAQLTCVRNFEELHDADTGTIPSFTSALSPSPGTFVPDIRSARSDDAVMLRDPDGSVTNRILVTFRRPSALLGDHVKVEARYHEAASDGAFVYTEVSGDQGEIYLSPVEAGVEYDFQLRYVRSNGKPGRWTAMESHTVAGKQRLPADVEGFTANANGNVVLFQWLQGDEQDVGGYELRYDVQGASDVNNAVIIKVAERGDELTTAAIPPGDWTCFIRRIDTSGNYSAVAAMTNVRVTSTNTIINAGTQAPDWLGVKTNMHVHWPTGKLVPDDQALASDSSIDLFEQFLFEPFDEHSYETTETDIGVVVSRDVRVWLDVRGGINPNEDGFFDYSAQVAFHDGTSYGAYQNWDIGEITGFQKVKAKITLEMASGQSFMTNGRAVVDAKKEFQEFTSVITAGTGVPIVFDPPFILAPTISITNASNSNDIPSFTGLDNTGVTPTFPSGASGSVHVTATGV